jgi:hypothetical protein
LFFCPQSGRVWKKPVPRNDGRFGTCFRLVRAVVGTALVPAKYWHAHVLNDVHARPLLKNPRWRGKFR